jgi:hypothetical protein
MERSSERAFRRAGHQTLLFDDKRSKQLVGRKLTQFAALTLARIFDADFVLLSKCQALDLTTVERIIAGRRNAVWYHDPPSYRNIDHPQVAHLAAVGRMSKTFFVSGFVDEWRSLGLPAKFLPSAADIELGPTKPDPRAASEIAFIGTGYDPSRTDFLMKVAAHYDVKVWGPGWEKWRESLKWSGRSVYGPSFAKVCSSARILLGINPHIARGATNYTSDRIWMTLQAGGFYLGQATAGVTDLLLDGVHCAWYPDLDACLDRCAHYLADDAARERVRKQGQRFVAEHHTFDQRIRNLISDEEFRNPLG